MDQTSTIGDLRHAVHRRLSEPDACADSQQHGHPRRLDRQPGNTGSQAVATGRRPRDSPNPPKEVMTLRFMSRILVSLALTLAATAGAQAACTDPAGPGVNWAGCNKNGIRVPGANLSGANLSGALLGPTAR